MTSFSSHISDNVPYSNPPSTFVKTFPLPMHVIDYYCPGSSVCGFRVCRPHLPTYHAPFNRFSNLLPKPNRRHRPQPQRGRPQGDIADHGDGSSRPGSETSLPGTAGGRSGPRKGMTGRGIRRSLTTPSSTATAAEGETDRRGGNGKGGREDHRCERGRDGGAAAAARQSSSSGVSSLTTASTQGGSGGEKSTRHQRRSTLSSAGSDVSSDDGMGSTSVAAAPGARVERDGAETATFAGKPHPDRKGEDDQSKENEDDEEMARRQPRARRAGEGNREGERDDPEGGHLGAP